MKTTQNFYKQTISTAWATGTGKRYVTVKPTPTDGWLVVSPNNSTLREIVAYSSTGTDGGGDYIITSARGVGGTTDQTHDIGEPIRMNITAEYWADMQSDIAQVQTNLDNAVLAGASHASTTIEGISKLSTAPVSSTNPIAVGDNDPRVPTTAQVARIPSSTITDALAGGSYIGTPSGTNKFITETAATPTTQTFTANGTYTKPTGVKYIEVELWGGGGGGAGVNGTTNFDGGGGGGGYNFKRFLASDVGATVTVTVGAGGTGGTNGDGGVGGDTSFGTLLFAYGGGQGAHYTAGSGTGSGAGGGGQLSAGSSAVGSAITNTAGSPGFPMVGDGRQQYLTSSSLAVPLNFLKNGNWGGGASGNETTKDGGNSVYGGAGGGSDSTGVGGTSVFGGNGSAASAGNSSSSAGAIPGGGGGAHQGTGGQTGVAGAGGRGEVRVKEYYS